MGQAISRRAFVGRLGGTVLTSAIAAQLLGACSTGARPSASGETATGQPTAATAGGAAAVVATPPTPNAGVAVVSRTGRVTLPTYMPPNAPPPDVQGSAITPPGYTSYPQKLLRSVPDTPGRGGEVNVITQTLTTLPTPMEANPIWQEANKRLGVTLKLNLTPYADYSTRIPTILAGSEMPDLLFLPNGFLVPGFPQFLEAKCADLTPYLSGDAAKDYPNLAAHPTSVWKTTVINNKIFGIGDPVPPFFWVHWHHQELLEQIGAQPPQTAADYKRLMQQVQKPNEGLYGIVCENGYLYGYGVINQLYTSIYGGANQWTLAGGKLVRTWETEQFKAALEYARDLWASGLYEPGSSGYNTLSARTAFLARKGLFRWDGNTTDIFHSYGAGAAMDPPPKVRLVPPFPAQAGGTPTYPLFHGSFGTLVMKKAEPERIKELLRVLNWIASPFGTEEAQITQYGIEGRDFTFDDRGNPVINDQGRQDQLPWNGIVNPARWYYDPLGPEYVTHVVGIFKQYEAVGVWDPTVGYYSESNGRQGVIANQHFGDGITDIVTGRRALSELDTLLAQWRNEGGDQVRHEYEDAMAAG
jgi:putative aldouronate transport system substrate-binding protein